MTLRFMKGKFVLQASNFLRAFRTMPQVSALGLVLHDIDENTGRVDFPRLIQSWQRFVLMQIHKVCGQFEFFFLYILKDNR